MNIFSTWNLLKNPERKQKLGYVVAFSCIIAALVSVICGVLSWSKETNKFNYADVKECTYKNELNECRNRMPSYCGSSFDCETKKCRFFGNSWCIFDSDERKDCFEKEKDCGHRDEMCKQKAETLAKQKADHLLEENKNRSFDVGIDKGTNIALYFVIILASVLAFIFIAIPFIKTGGLLASKGAMAGASIVKKGKKATNRIIQDKIQYGDGFDYQAYKLLLALQIKILDKVGPISETQMSIIQEQYDACDYKSEKFHGRFTKLQSSNSDLDSCIRSVRKAFVGHDELKLNVVEYLLAFAIACGYDENMERNIRYVADNLGLNKDVYTVIRDSMLKNASQVNYVGLEDFYGNFEKNGIFSTDEILQLGKMELNRQMPPMKRSYFREFFRFVFPLLVKQSYADGTLNEYRISILKMFYSNCSYAECDFLRLLKSNFADGHDIQFHVMALKQSTDRKKEFRIYALENMMLYANRCGELPRQLDMIERVANGLEVSENTYETLKNKFASQSGCLETAIEDLRTANKFHFM